MTGGMLRALATSGVGTLLNMVLGAGTTKIVAVLGGPGGLAIFSQVRQVSQWSVILATLNGQNSIVRRSSSSAGMPGNFLRTVAVLFASGGGLVSLSILLLAPYIARAMFSSSDASLILAIRVTSVTILLGTLASFVSGLVNSLAAVTALAMMTTAGGAGSLLAAYPLLSAGRGDVGYALLPAVGFAASVAFGLWWLGRNHPGMSAGIRGGRFEAAAAREHVSYSAAVLVTGLAGSGAVLILRSIYIHHGGLPLGGIFDSAWTVSVLYVTPLLSTYGTYYFPDLSRNREDPVYVRERVSAVFRLSSILGTLLVSFMVLLSPFVIHTLYSGSFSSSRSILRWMFVGDFLKITSFVFGILLHVFAERRRLILSDLAFQGTLVGLVLVGISMSREVVGPAFTLVNACYVLFIWHYASTRHGVRIDRRDVRTWATGLMLIVTLSAWRWRDESPALLAPLATWMVVGGAYLLLVTTRSERALAWRAARSRFTGRNGARR